MWDAGVQREAVWGCWGTETISGRQERFWCVRGFSCELAASKHKGISASAGKTGFSREKYFLAKRSEVLRVPQRAAAAPGRRELQASISRKCLKAQNSQKSQPSSYHSHLQLRIRETASLKIVRKSVENSNKA